MPENPKRPKPFIHTLTVLCFDLHSFDTQECELHTTKAVNTSLTEVKYIGNNGNWNGMCCEKTWKSYLFYMRTGSHNVSLTRQYMSPTGEKIHWREAARRRLQISHADTKHTEFSYMALYEAQRVQSKYIRVIYLYLPFQPWAKEPGDPKFKEEANVAKMTSHKPNSETINPVDKMVGFSLFTT